MPTIGPMLAASGQLGLMYADRLLAGVTPDMFARFARPGGQVLQSNHPAFIFGHLCMYPARAMQLVKVPPAEHAAPATYEPLFKAGAECKDDPDGTIYPPMEELTQRFRASYAAAIAAVREADDALLAAENPGEGRMKELFATVGSAIGFYLGGHVQNHLGQMSAWRRAMGLGAA